ncbi:MAG TPA: purine-nucleoside phosphorylase [Gemmatimonadota bacterium]|nr:purine-nucleoside phosphorylase [Gemmatimonadota bacterium]
MNPTRWALAEAALDRLHEAGAGEIESGLILGSGLSFLADELADPIVVGYRDIPGFPRATVEGHAGNFVIGRLDDTWVGMAQGRFHAYEGYDPATVVLPVRVLHLLGARELLLTNAAGSLHRIHPPGTLMAIRSHINLQFASPLLGRSPERIENPFPALMATYAPELLERLHAAGLAERILVREGVYGGVLGPSYETPAEVRFLRRIGADAVGMSTVGEVIAAGELGLPVAGVSLLTNLASGIGRHALSHAEVTHVAERVQNRFARLVRRFVGGRTAA